MNDRIDGFFFKNLIDCLVIQHIDLVKGYMLAGDFLHAAQRFLTGIVKVVHDNDLISGV